MEINKKELGKKISDIRITSSKVQNELQGEKPTLERFAELVGSNKSNVLRWENGENTPSDITLRKIAEYGNTTVVDLLGTGDGIDVREIIKEIRKNEDMTQEQFANKIGVSRSYLNDVENARNNPSVKTIEKLANKMGMTMHGFFGVSKVETSLRSFSDVELLEELKKRALERCDGCEC